MNNFPNRPDPLEAFVTRAMREIPERRVPVGFEARVLQEINRLAALPWWKKSFAYWPQGVRQIFFLLSAILAGLIVAGLFALTMRVPDVSVASGIVERSEWLIAGRDIVASFGRWMAEFVRDLPGGWVYGAAAAVATAFAFVIGTGAAAYRYLNGAR